MAAPVRTKVSPKLNHEKILRLLQTSVQSVLNSYEEPEAILLGVSWRPELGDDLPFGMLLIKEEVSAELLNRCLKQNAKMSDYIVQGIRKQISELENLVKQIEAQMEKQSASSVRPTLKEVDNGQEATTPTHTGPATPGTERFSSPA